MHCLIRSVESDGRHRYGVAPRLISRHDLTKALYDALGAEAQEKLFPDKKLSSITSRPDGVQVTCTDGSKYDASFVIGADGAHSMVRQCMRSLALEHGSKDVNVEQPYLITYRALYMRFPKGNIKVGATCETHGSSLATQLFAGEDFAVIGVYERLIEPTRKPKSIYNCQPKSIHRALGPCSGDCW